MAKLNPLDHPICFEKPARSTPGSAWTEHIPFAMFIIDVLRPGTLVELGTHRGDSYCAFCQAVKKLGTGTRCWAVDTWRGDPQTGLYGPEVLEDLRAHHDPLYGEFSTLLQTTFDEAAGRFGVESIDLLHIDGYHIYEAVKHDFETWLPRVSRRGIVLLHDIAEDMPGYGAKRLWQEVKGRYPHFEFTHGHGLGVLAKTGDSAGELRGLFTSDERQAEAVRAFFATLGKTATLGAETAAANRALQDSAARAAELERKNLDLQAEVKARQRQIAVLERRLTHVERLQHQVTALHEHIAQVQGSVVVGLAQRFAGVVAMAAPGGSLRRRLYDLAVAGLRVLVHHGPRRFAASTLAYITRRRPRDLSEDRYRSWVSRTEPGREELERQRLAAARADDPRISIIMPVWNPREAWLREAIESVLAQTYHNWELCIADGGSTRPGVRKALGKHASADSRVKVKYLRENKGIAGNSNEALDLATGDYIALMDDDDELAPFALFEVAEFARQHPESDVIYSDEDKITPEGRRFAPFFKPDWSPDLLHSCMYLGHLTVYRKSLVGECGRFRTQYDYSQDYDLALRATERARAVGHIPKVLYHWRAVPGSAARNGKAFARASNIAALEAAVRRRGYDGEAAVAGEPHLVNRVRYHVRRPPMVSIIIPTDSEENILPCVDSVLTTTAYDNYEVLVVTNSRLAFRLTAVYAGEPRIRTVTFDHSFNFSAKCNLGARHAAGEFVLFLNDDMEVLDGNWIEEMVGPFQRSEIGGVACKLVYPDNTIQHAGLVTGVRGLVGTAFHCQHCDTHEYFHFVQSTRNVSALSAACLMVRKAVFEAIGGFDENNTPVRHSDVDLSFRIRERGYLLVYTPFARLRHKGHQSLKASDVRYRPDKADLYLLKKWPEEVARDPYYTDNMRDILYEDASWPYKLRAGRKWQGTDRSKDILFISHDLSLSGAPLAMFNLALFAARHGDFVTVISPTDGELSRRYEEAGIPVIIDGSVAGTPLETTLQLMADYDLVVVNTILLWRTVEALKRTSVPVVWYIHESEAGLSLIRSNPGIAWWLDAADIVMFPSKWTADLYRKHADGRNFEVMYPGADCLEGTYDGARNGLLRVIEVGSIEPRKGQDILAECIRSLPEELAASFEFHFAGRPLDQAFYRKLESMVGNLGTVHFEGQVEREELARLYNSSDVLVCTSRDEGFPLVLLEAMACGKAVIATAVGGIPEMIDNGQTGIIIPAEDADALRQSLLALHKDPELRHRLGEKARERYHKAFTQDKFAARFFRAIKDRLGIEIIPQED